MGSRYFFLFLIAGMNLDGYWHVGSQWWEKGWASRLDPSFLTPPPFSSSNITGCILLRPSEQSNDHRRGEGLLNLDMVNSRIECPYTSESIHDETSDVKVREHPLTLHKT